MPPEKPNESPPAMALTGEGFVVGDACYPGLAEAHTFHFAQGAEVHPCSMEHLPMRTDLGSVNSDTCPRTTVQPFVVVFLTAETLKPSIFIFVTPP